MKTISRILIAVCLLANAQAMSAQCPPEKATGLPNDPLYKYQWHLSGEAFDYKTNSKLDFNPNVSTQTLHLNVKEVWPKYKGEGTYIAIVDFDVLLDHKDLKANIAERYYQSNRSYHPTDHGALVAGIAAARGYNGIGVRGVAPYAKFFISGRGGTDTDDIENFTRHSTITAVSNHSYGASSFESSMSRRNKQEMQYMAMETGISEGFDGKGTVYVFSAGNNGDSDNSNYDYDKNYHAVVTVCGVSYRGKDTGSEPGANLWVCAFDSDFDRKHEIITTDLCVSHRTGKPINPHSDYAHPGYRIRGSGTSLSAPMVSGIVALMRQANPNLGWRDVKLILAASARKNDSDDADWQQSGTKYGSFSERYHFNHKYGFGLVDAKAAVDLAEGWINVPPRVEDTVVKEETPATGKEIRRSLDVQTSAIDFIEHVDAEIDFAIGNYRDLSIELISPSGTTSTLAEEANDRRLSNPSRNLSWRFGSSRHLGEDPEGTWKLIVKNARAGTVTYRDWELRIRGYQVKLKAVAAADLSDLNKAKPPLTLSLSGAKWKDPLKPSDFRLINAPPGLRIKSLKRTTSTQVQLQLQFTGKLKEDRRFAVQATTGTVSNLTRSLISNDIEIAPIAYNREATIPNGSMGFNYHSTVEEILSSPTTLSYTIQLVDKDGNELVDEEGNKLELEDIGLTLEGSTISGTPIVAGTHCLRITAIRRHDNIARTEDITLNVAYTIQTQLKVFLEALLE